MSDETQELVLTQSMVLDDLPKYGSIDVSVHSESACGLKSTTQNIVICDTKVHASPNITKSPDFGGAGKEMDFMWADTPAVEKGHMYKLTWYTLHDEKTFRFQG